MDIINYVVLISDITTIYLSLGDSLVSPFRCEINGLEKEIKEEAGNAEIWTK